MLAERLENNKRFVVEKRKLKKLFFYLTEFGLLFANKLTQLLLIKPKNKKTKNAPPNKIFLRYKKTL